MQGKWILIALISFGFVMNSLAQDDGIAGQRTQIIDPSGPSGAEMEGAGGRQIIERLAGQTKLGERMEDLGPRGNILEERGAVDEDLQGIRYRRSYDQGRRQDHWVDRPYDPDFPYHPPFWGRYPYGYPMIVVQDPTDIPVDLPSASYQVVEPVKPQWVKGHYEEVAFEDIIEGEFVEVYHPAVYRQQEDGSLALVEEARTTQEPKTRIILSRVWVEGHWRQGIAPPEAEETTQQPGEDSGDQY